MRVSLKIYICVYIFRMRSKLNQCTYLNVKTRCHSFVVASFIFWMTGVMQLFDVKFDTLDRFFVGWPQYPVTKARLPILPTVDKKQLTLLSDVRAMDLYTFLKLAEWSFIYHKRKCSRDVPCIIIVSPFVKLIRWSKSYRAFFKTSWYEAVSHCPF